MPEVSPAACITTPAIDAWVNTPFANQTGIFTATFDATPSQAAPLDCVMALSSGPKNAFGDFACLVRFPDTGKIDARNGAIVRLGRKHGIPTPCNQMAVALLGAMKPPK